MVVGADLTPYPLSHGARGRWANMVARGKRLPLVLGSPLPRERGRGVRSAAWGVSKSVYCLVLLLFAFALLSISEAIEHGDDGEQERGCDPQKRQPVSGSEDLDHVDA